MEEKQHKHDEQIGPNEQHEQEEESLKNATDYQNAFVHIEILLRIETQVHGLHPG
jgi:hypothetical protein